MRRQKRNRTKAQRAAKDLAVQAGRASGSHVNGGSQNNLRPAVQQPGSTRITDGTSNTLMFG